MGTDLEDTLDELDRVTKYYLSCCNPKNAEAIKVALETLKTVMKEK